MQVKSTQVALVITMICGLIMLTACQQDAASDRQNNERKPTSSATTMARRAVTLAVPGMSCPMCPITVHQALLAVDGVQEASAELATKQARVVFDPARTDVDALITAIKQAGFAAHAVDLNDV